MDEAGKGPKAVLNGFSKLDDGKEIIEQVSKPSPVDLLVRDVF